MGQVTANVVFSVRHPFNIEIVLGDIPLSIVVRGSMNGQGVEQGFQMSAGIELDKHLIDLNEAHRRNKPFLL